MSAILTDYLKIPLRHLLKNKWLSAINIAGLAVGLCCCILILIYVKDELGFDRFHQNADRLFQLTCVRSEQDGTSKQFAIASLVQGPAFKRGIPEIEAFTRVNAKTLVIKKGEQLFSEQVSWVDAGFFQMFTFPLITGNGQQVLKDPHAMVLSETTALKYFGSKDVVGQTLDLEMNGKFEPFVVSGIARDAPENSSIQFNILLPFSTYEKSSPDNGWMWVSFPTYFLLRPGTRAAPVPGKMQQIYRSAAAEEIDLNVLAGYGNKFTWGMEKMDRMHLSSRYEGTPGSTDPVYPVILTAIAGFILLIACINFVNLTTAQSLKRQKEIGIRKVLGTSRRQLMTRFFSESLIVSFVAFLIGITGALFSLPLLNQVTGKNFRVNDLLQADAFPGLAALYIITAFMAGFYPAWILSRAHAPMSLLSGHARVGGGSRLAKGLLVAQFSIASFLMIATMLVSAQFNLLMTTPLGYPDKNLLTFTIAEGIRSRPVMELFRSALVSVPGVAEAGYRNVGHFSGKVQSGTTTFTATYQRVDEHFMPALGVQTLAGRNFAGGFPSDSTNSVLVNETFVRRMRWSEPLGKLVDHLDIPGWGDRKLTVVGVVRDYHAASLKQAIQPAVFIQDNSLPLGLMLIRLRGDHVPETLLRLDRVYRSLSPNHPFDYTFQDEANRKDYESEARWKKLIWVAAIITLIISVTGLWGLSLLTVNKREKEIAVRKVLGSTARGIVYLLSKEFTTLVLVSFCIAIPLAWLAVTKWLQTFPYRIKITWLWFALAGGIILLSTLATIACQVYRSAIKSPVKVIRS